MSEKEKVFQEITFDYQGETFTISNHPDGLFLKRANKPYLYFHEIESKGSTDISSRIELKQNLKLYKDALKIAKKIMDGNLKIFI